MPGEVPAPRRPQRQTRNVNAHIAGAVVAFAGAIYNLGSAMHLFQLTDNQQAAINLVILTGIGLGVSARAGLNQRAARKRRPQ